MNAPKSDALRTRANEEELKDLFAYFGRAYYFADVLHRGVILVAAFGRLPPVGLTTRSRVEEVLSENQKLSFGVAVTRAKEFLPGDIFDLLESAVERRNFLAHHFWYEKFISLLKALASSR